ncbi:MAG: hypothetical protein QOK44_2231 [Betaproteobacteria bacterium]|jgi:hypothetical protein|nr:hypothetical protein [Betaproteobacteria bacterium]
MTVSNSSIYDSSTPSINNVRQHDACPEGMNEPAQPTDTEIARRSEAVALDARAHGDRKFVVRASPIDGAHTVARKLPARRPLNSQPGCASIR